MCTTCQALHFSPRDITEFQCSTGHICGHIAFHPKDIEHFHTAPKMVLTCKACKQKLPQLSECHACKRSLPKDEFDKNVFDHAQKHGRARVCLSCQKIGYSPKDCTKYHCSSGHDVGHTAFAQHRNAFKHAKGRGQLLLCDACRLRDSEREARLKRLLSGDGSWKCTCKKVKRGHRSYGALHDQLHSDKCQLSPRYAFEKRWDGKNVGITWADLEFLAARSAY